MGDAYVRIRSWHLIESRFTSRGGIDMVETYCGRGPIAISARSSGPTVHVVYPTAPELPLDDKSCESCLRNAAARQTRQVGEE